MMPLPSSMRRYVPIFYGRRYNDDYIEDVRDDYGFCIDWKADFKTEEGVLKILRAEAELRTSEKYLNETRKAIKNNDIPNYKQLTLLQENALIS